MSFGVEVFRKEFFSFADENSGTSMSALKGVTNLLLENKKTKAPGVYQKLANREDLRSELAAVGVTIGVLNKFLRPKSCKPGNLHMP
jgi:hypothetical protein